MDIRSCEKVFSKVKKLVVDPRSSKYIDKLIFIANKHWERNKHVLGLKKSQQRQSGVYSANCSSSGRKSEDSSSIGVSQQLVTSATEMGKPGSSSQMVDSTINPETVDSNNLSDVSITQELFSSSELTLEVVVNSCDESEKDYIEVLKDSISILKSDIHYNEITVNPNLMLMLEEAEQATSINLRNKRGSYPDRRFVVNIFESRNKQRRLRS